MLILLSVAGSDASLKDSLNRLLSVYRENRELIAMIADMSKGASSLSAGAPPAEHEKETNAAKSEQKESRSEQTGNYKILEEFLKTHGV